MAQNFGEVVERLRRSTVRILSGSRGHGSGVIWSKDGTIVTNAHVIDGGKEIRAELWDGSQHAAEIISRDLRNDLAQLKVNVNDLASIVSRDSSRVHTGETAIAIGNPLGFTGALSTGFVRAVGTIRGLGRKPWIQAAVHLAPGNSGGPLADAEGRVLGINTMVISRGTALAIPSEVVSEFLHRGSRPMLGISVQQVADRTGLAGLLIMSVIENSPAERASLMIGDLLIGASDTRFHSADDLSDSIDRFAGGVLRLRFLRGDRSVEREVAIALPNQHREAA